jgi:pimeloyl-ACP methyl ester carboxylesterase
LHYEVYGRGRPIILLHGWLGSWGLWQDTMAYLGQFYRTYALDFWGFGESGRKSETFQVQDYVSMVHQFMEQLGIVCAPLVGHSMGGTVSLLEAVHYPDRVRNVTVIGSPIVGSSLSWLLKLFGTGPVAYVVHHNLWGLKLGFRLLAPFYSRHPQWADMMDRDIARTTLQSFLLSIASLRRTDVRPFLDQIKVPVMGMYGEKDIVVHPNQWQPLKAGIPCARIERFPTAGHFIMMDEPQRFRDALYSFLNSETAPSKSQPAVTDTVVTGMGA